MVEADLRAPKKIIYTQQVEDGQLARSLEFLGQGRCIMWEFKAHRRGNGMVEEGREGSSWLIS